MAEEAGRLGLKVNRKKKKIMKINARYDVINMNSEVVEHVERFSYLGAVVTKEGGIGDMKNRITKATTAFMKLKKMEFKHNLQNNQDKALQIICEVRALVRMWNMENDERRTKINWCISK